jgi:CheY-like chemotaxis protein
MVSGEGLTPLLAKNGAEALQLVRAGDPDVLLADLRMPGMDGMELMRKAKDLDPELPVILITGSAEVRGAVEALRAGAHDYLAKPVRTSAGDPRRAPRAQRAAAEAGVEASWRITSTRPSRRARPSAPARPSAR